MSKRKLFHINNSQGLSHFEIYQACLNIGVNLDCGGCATTFYTGTGHSVPHDKNCLLNKPKPEPELKLTTVEIIPGQDR